MTNVVPIKHTNNSTRDQLLFNKSMQERGFTHEQTQAELDREVLQLMQTRGLTYEEARTRHTGSCPRGSTRKLDDART